MDDSPIRPYKMIIEDSGSQYSNRIMVATATTGLVRFEWAAARYGQMIPTNWSQVSYSIHVPGSLWLDHYVSGHLVADAQNIIVKKAIEKDFEWLLLWEHDVIAPEDSMIKLNNYIRDEQIPVVSGLYYTRSRPSEPLVYRGRGTGAFNKFKIGEKVWCDGVPTGFLLIHMGILREMWKESSEYMAKNELTRRVFDTPRNLWFDPESGHYNSLSGTSDLDCCSRVMNGGYFKKAGWGKYQRKKYPFLVDTSIFCRHINPDGEVFP